MVVVVLVVDVVVVVVAFAIVVVAAMVVACVVVIGEVDVNFWFNVSFISTPPVTTIMFFSFWSQQYPYHSPPAASRSASRVIISHIETDDILFSILVYPPFYDCIITHAPW